jgi:hypothetical protein
MTLHGMAFAWHCIRYGVSLIFIITFTCLPNFSRALPTTVSI